MILMFITESTFVMNFETIIRLQDIESLLLAVLEQIH